MQNQESSPCPCRDLGLLLIRLVLAAVFIYHGGQKLFGWFGGPGLQGFAGMLADHHAPFPYVAAILSGADRVLRRDCSGYRHMYTTGGNSHGLQHGGGDFRCSPP